MKKTISIEIEACDVCGENEVARYYHGGAAVCKWCGKQLCSECKKAVEEINFCPICRNLLFSKWFSLIGETSELVDKMNKKKIERDEELKKVIDEVRIKNGGVL